jgi:HAD superfamily hydrolase (TIGR01490 family)
MKSLVIFDFDGTLTQKDSFRAFLKFTHRGLPYWVNVLRSLPFILMFYSGMIREKKLKETMLSFFYKNQTATELNGWGKRFIDHLNGKGFFRASMLSLFEKYRQQQARLVVVSASPEIWIKPFCELYHLEYICTRLEFDRNDRFSGKISGENCKGEVKKMRIQDVYRLSDYAQIIVYGDSDGDLEMMELATEKHWV